MKLFSQKKLSVAVVLLITVSVSFTLYPLQAKAFVDFGYILKEFALDIIARAVARALLNKYVNKLINRIAGVGRGANPAFVQDWREFQLLGQYRGESVFRGLLFEAIRQGLICPELVPILQRVFNPRTVFNVNTILQRVNDLQPYSVRTRCTLPQDLPPLDVDFGRAGGWETWRRSFSPENNVAGIVLMAFDELERQRFIEEKSDVHEAVSGTGFLSLKTGCTSEPGEILPPDQEGPPRPPRKTCKILGQTVTPAKWIERAAGQKIEKAFEFVVNADEISEIIVAIVGAVIDRAFSSRGLASGRATGPGDRTPGQDQRPTLPTCQQTFNEQICPGGHIGGDDECVIQCADGRVVSCAEGCGPIIP